MLRAVLHTDVEVGPQ